MPSTFTSVPGKSILFGEHAVVYGYPSIAVPLDSISFKIKLLPRPNKNNSIIVNDELGENLIFEDLEPQHTYRTAIESILHELKITRLPPMEIRLSSTIPIASGLGSSAAFAVCLVKALSAFLGFRLSNKKVNEIAYQIEIFQHGTPSGIDNTAIAYNKPVFFRKGFPSEFLKIGARLNLVIADTGVRTMTKETVAQVRKFKESDPSTVDEIIQKIGDVVERAKNDLENGNLHALGSLMTENHDLLNKLGVSCKELDHLVKVAITEGALGAKLCGSGKGGNIVALCDGDKAEHIKTALQNNGSNHCFTSVIKTTKGEVRC